MGIMKRGMNGSMKIRRRGMGLDCLLPLAALGLALSVAGALQAWGQSAPAGCKSYGNGPCCDPAVSRHLSRGAVFNACQEDRETFLGEVGSVDTCRYVFGAKQRGGNTATSSATASTTPEPTPVGHVEVHAPAASAVAEIPEEPTDPFFSWARIGKAFVTVRAKDPRGAPLLAASTGIWLPTEGSFVSVNASTRVCTRSQAQQLARQLR